MCVCVCERERKRERERERDVPVVFVRLDVYDYTDCFFDNKKNDCTAQKLEGTMKENIIEQKTNPSAIAKCIMKN